MPRRSGRPQPDRRRSRIRHAPVCGTAVDASGSNAGSPHGARPGADTVVPQSLARDRPSGRRVFERFTDRARRVVVLAQEEARLLNHNYIGTEHILLGLIHEGEGVAAKALESLGISPGGRPHPGRGDHRPGRLVAQRPHPLHAPRQEGPRAVAPRGAAARPQLHRHRAHPPRPHPRGRGRRRPGAGEARRRPVSASASRSSSCCRATPVAASRPAAAARTPAPPPAPAASRPSRRARSCSTSSGATSPSSPGRRSSTRSSAAPARSSG